MDHPGFWAPAGPFSLSKLASYAGAEIPEISTAEAGRLIRSVKALDVAGGSDVSFLDNRKYLAALKQTGAAAVFVSAEHASRVPATSVPLISRDPYRAFAKSLEMFFPDAGHPKVGGSRTGHSSRRAPSSGRKRRSGAARG